MELPSKILGQTAFNTSLKIKEHLLIVMDKSTHEEHLAQPFQTNIKQFKILLNNLKTVAFLIGDNGIFNVTNSKKNLFDEINY